MRVEVINGVDIEEFKKRLKENNFTCICSIDYGNPEMKCICKEFRDAEVGQVCHCGIFLKIEK